MRCSQSIGFIMASGVFVKNYNLVFIHDNNFTTYDIGPGHLLVCDPAHFYVYAQGPSALGARREIGLQVSGQEKWRSWHAV